jgi:hypothetical protein
MLRQSCTLKKLVQTEINDEYDQTEESFIDYTVNYCEIQPVTSEDLVFLPPGTLNIGDARAWFKDKVSSTESLSLFEKPSLYTYDNTKITIENNQAKLKGSGTYPTDDPTIVLITGRTFSAGAFLFSIKETKPSGSNITYILSKDNGSTWYYWSGTAWVTSNGTYSQSSNSADIIANLTTLPFISGTFKWKVFLHSAGSVTPILEKIRVKFGISVVAEDRIIDHQGREYMVTIITDYYTKDSVLLKEVYLRKVVG